MRQEELHCPVCKSNADLRESVEREGSFHCMNCGASFTIEEFEREA